MQKQIFVHVYFGRNKGILTGFVIFSIMSGTSYMLWSFLFEQASGFAGGTVDTSIQQLCLSAGLCLLYFVVSQQLMFYFQRRLLKQINTQLKQDVFHALMRKGEAKFTEKNSAVYLSVLNNDVANLENNYFAKIPEILQNGFVFLTCAGVLCYYDVRIVCLVILTALLPVAVPFLIGEKLSQKSKELYEELENYNRKLKDWMGGFEVIHSFQVEDEVKKRFAKSVEEVEKRRYEGRRYQNPYGILTLLLTYLILSIQLVVSAYLVFTGSISERMLLSIFYLISSVNNPIREIAYLLLDVKAAIPNARKVETLLNEKSEESKKTGEPVKSVMPLELKEVRFGYTKEKEVLHGVTVRFEKGKKYAIVGSSGCGKSTLLKLLANYYEDYEGEILIGKQELRAIDRKSLSRKMAMIHQNVFLFEDTLRANITMFQEYPDEEIKAAVKKAGLEKIVEDNPLGIEQMVCENGNNFSGGEKQRIAIARAILTRAEVLLLDEATSSLDAELSMQIEQLILSQKETTILNVTHRFHESILKQYDCILTMHQGKIVEMGTFEELMKKQQFFYSLYTVNH
ncbi:MAG: ABC transporter ATP-binding protein [[Ruminococcus] gnavus]|nr:ABC transporter ATP-binding protein [Mediterraneibacter gnavus]